MKKIVLHFSFLFIIISAFAQKANDAILQKRINFFIDSLMNIMTLEEKIGQLNQYTGFWEVTGPAPNEGNKKQKYDYIKKGWVGSMLNVTGVENVRKVQEIAVKESRLGIPLIFGMDVIHGYKTIFPIPLAEAASWNLDLIQAASKVVAIEASAEGINWTFAPMIDVARDPRWGRVMEGAGEDPFLTAQVGAAKIKGFQGNHLNDKNSIAACAKHFAGYGFITAGRDYNTVDIGTSTLFNTVLPPFKMAVENNVATVMNAFTLLNGIPATGNEFLVKDILKTRWNFKGFVVSDWGSIGEMIVHGYAKDNKHAAELAIKAGCDMDMETNAYVTELKQLVQEKKVDISLINDAVKRILTIKFQLGLFDNPFKFCNIEDEKNNILTPSHQQAALQSALEAIVLLKNKDNILPLKKEQQNIAIIGSLANDKDNPLGNWRAQAIQHSAVSVVEAMQKISPQIIYTEGVKAYKNLASLTESVKMNNDDTSGFADAIATAKKSQVVIMVLGESAFQTGEARNRTDIGIPKLQQQLLEAVYQVNKNIILVLMNGRPLTLTWADEHIPAIVEAWHLGSQSGNAIAKVLFGEYNPSGKLPMSFPRNVGQIPIYYNAHNTGRPTGKDEDVFWSHYIDAPNTPLYPFGYGMSYTTFDYLNFKLIKKENKKYIINVDVKNVGNRDGAEIIQLYIKDKISSVVRPVKELKGFKKVNLKIGQQETISFNIDENTLGYYNNEGQFFIEPGEFEIMIGAASNDIKFLETIDVK